MITVDFTQVSIKRFITHKVGNKMRDEGLDLSNELSTTDLATSDYLVNYFLLPIRREELYRFSHAVDMKFNEVYSIAGSVFSGNGDFVTDSQSIARLLYEQSLHPKIKEGQFNFVQFSNAIIGDEVVEAIGIFKSETSNPYLKMENVKAGFSISHDFGFDVKGLDKGCIIFNTNQEAGFDVLIADNGKNMDAQYWRDSFLNVVPARDEFQQTNQFLSIAKDFVTKGLGEEAGISKVDKIELLNRSVEYFKTHDSFKKEEFENEVFKSPEMIETFRSFDTAFREEKGVDVGDSFDISNSAVKKQARVFKRVLKLDKNFDIHIHGDRNLLEKGVEKDGRKFYKIYYQQES